MKLVKIAVVQGAEGPSLQVLGEHGGERVAGPKAWGNPYNKPIAEFEVDAKELVRVIRENAYTYRQEKAE